MHIHGRAPRLRAGLHRWIAPAGSLRRAALDHLAEAHRIHHLYGRAPYGMLVPVVPAELRERASRTERDPLRDRRRPVPAR